MIEGERELLRALEVFPGKLQRNVLRTALRKSGAVVAKQARANVRPVSKTIARAVGVRPLLYDSGVSLAIVGVVAGTSSKAVLKRRAAAKAAGKRFHGPWNTAHLVEGGTAPHPITIRKRRGKALKTPYVMKHPGTTAHPFIRPAREQTAGQVEQIYISGLRAGVEKAARDSSK
jgi:HK97 gp10 family phage protein